jgi:hypothetical protein
MLHDAVDLYMSLRRSHAEDFAPVFRTEEPQQAQIRFQLNEARLSGFRPDIVRPRGRGSGWADMRSKSAATPLRPQGVEDLRIRGAQQGTKFG